MNLLGIKNIICLFNNKRINELYIRITTMQQKIVKFNYCFYCCTDNSGNINNSGINVSEAVVSFDLDKTPLLYFSMPKRKVMYIYDVEENDHFSLIRVHLNKYEKYFIKNCNNNDQD